MTVTTTSLPRAAARAAVADCTCPDGSPAARSAASMSRRSLLKALGGAAITLTATEAVHTRVAMAAPGYTGDVLVVLSLRGGFDGLSAVVPGGVAAPVPLHRPQRVRRRLHRRRRQLDRLGPGVERPCGVAGRIGRKREPAVPRRNRDAHPLQFLRERRLEPVRREVGRADQGTPPATGAAARTAPAAPSPASA